jgi:hypothetical protein
MVVPRWRCQSTTRASQPDRRLDAPVEAAVVSGGQPQRDRALTDCYPACPLWVTFWVTTGANCYPLAPFGRSSPARNPNSSRFQPSPQTSGKALGVRCSAIELEARDEAQLGRCRDFHTVAALARSVPSRYPRSPGAQRVSFTVDD